MNHTNKYNDLYIYVVGVFLYEVCFVKIVHFDVLIANQNSPRVFLVCPFITHHVFDVSLKFPWKVTPENCNNSYTDGEQCVHHASSIVVPHRR